MVLPLLFSWLSCHHKGNLHWLCSLWYMYNFRYTANVLVMFSVNTLKLGKPGVKVWHVVNTFFCINDLIYSDFQELYLLSPNWINVLLVPTPWKIWGGKSASVTRGWWLRRKLSGRLLHSTPSQPGARHHCNLLVPSVRAAPFPGPGHSAVVGPLSQHRLGCSLSLKNQLLATWARGVSNPKGRTQVWCFLLSA